MKRTAKQFAVSVAVGGASALLDVGVTALLLYFTVAGLVAVSVGFTAGVGLNYTLHAKVTFQQTKISGGSIGRYLTVLMLNYLLTLAIVEGSVTLFAAPVLAGKIVSLPVIAVIGYILSRYWVFAERSAAG